MSTLKLLYLLKEKTTISDAIFWRVQVLILAKTFNYALNIFKYHFIIRIEPTKVNMHMHVNNKLLKIKENSYDFKINKYMNK